MMEYLPFTEMSFDQVIILQSFSLYSASTLVLASSQKILQCLQVISSKQIIKSINECVVTMRKADCHEKQLIFKKKKEVKELNNLKDLVFMSPLDTHYPLVKITLAF